MYSAVPTVLRTLTIQLHAFTSFRPCADREKLSYCSKEKQADHFHSPQPKISSRWYNLSPMQSGEKPKIRPPSRRSTGSPVANDG